ncbi:RSVR protein, partial [Campylorhamphus procurvoides]|nr:RSVR protein [Campylorhamphus procurvoides]
PDEFQCTPGDLCYPRGWLCDGHPDCEGEEDERGCGTGTVTEPVAVTEPSPGPAGSAAVLMARPGSEWVSACALSSPGLLSILVAASSVAVWGLFKAKSRSNTISLEKASREQLMADKSQ